MADWWEKGCMVEGQPMVNGYSRINVAGVRVYAHRHAWEQKHGSIPAGKQVHHLCRNRRCSNVEHLVLVDIVQHGRLHRVHDCEHTDGFCRRCFNERRRQRYRADAVYRARRLSQKIKR